METILLSLLNQLTKFFFDWKKNEVEKIAEARRNVKREVCLKALRVATALVSHIRWENEEGFILKEPVSTKDAREVQDLLACTCTGNEVYVIFMRIVEQKRISPDILADLRDAIRKEVFGIDNILKVDRVNSAFIGSLVDDVETITGKKREKLNN